MSRSFVVSFYIVNIITAVVGCQNAVRLGAHPLVCVVCGIMTATFGGMIRDVICR